MPAMHPAFPTLSRPVAGARIRRLPHGWALLPWALLPGAAAVIAHGALDSALAEPDSIKRDAAYQDVCKVMNTNLPWATLWVANRYGIVSTKVKDFVWTPAPGGGPYQANPQKWSIAE
jgi:hypothetical protein